MTAEERARAWLDETFGNHPHLGQTADLAAEIRAAVEEEGERCARVMDGACIRFTGEGKPVMLVSDGFGGHRKPGHLMGDALRARGTK